MNKTANKALLGAAVAGIMGACIMAAPSAVSAKRMKAPKLIKCFGVNKCAGFGSCGGQGHKCAGKNSCKGLGWLLMPKKSCEALAGGSVGAPAKPAKPMSKGM